MIIAVIIKLIQIIYLQFLLEIWHCTLSLGSKPDKFEVGNICFPSRQPRPLVFYLSPLYDIRLKRQSWRLTDQNPLLPCWNAKSQIPCGEKQIWEFTSCFSSGVTVALHALVYHAHADTIYI